MRFDVVTVYYFPRRQGFTSVPSQGGSSLGMARHHSSIRHYTLGEFAREQEISHRHTLRQHLRQEKLNARKMKVGFRFYLRVRVESVQRSIISTIFVKLKYYTLFLKLYMEYNNSKLITVFQKACVSLFEVIANNL